MVAPDGVNACYEPKLLFNMPSNFLLFIHQNLNTLRNTLYMYYLFMTFDSIDAVHMLRCI